MSIDLKYGVPTVCLHTSMFVTVTRSVVRMNGAPRMRQVYLPHPVMGKTVEQIEGYVYGSSPISGKSVMQEVVEGLTQPLNDEDRKGLTFVRNTSRLCEPASEAELNQLFLDNNWTDKLPIVLPTVERVAEMMRHTSRKPDEIVGHHTATHFREVWECTVEQVAVNAVMAGARPEYFPVILAIASTGASARGSSTSSMASMVVVNGPVRKEIDMNAGTGAMGPYNQANATIGRAFGLLSQNLQGGSVPGETYMGSMGNAVAYASPTFAENEERSPFEPLHVQRGYRAEQSVVSVFAGMRHMAFTLGLRRAHWREQVRNMMRGMDPNESPTFLLDPIAARLFQDIGGLRTKKELIDWVCENACMPAGEYWDYQLVQNYLLPRATFGEEPLASKLRAAPDQMVPLWTPEQVNVIVVGGETNGYWRIAGARLAGSACVDDWR
ncbi:MAG TPA: UGSC family (seleno)protein [Burkholderiales bacterium]|nr:UGSC family (seleno)protein [Burkholderiales bacterium]